MGVIVDNVAITAGSGTTIAADDVGGVLYQRIKSTWGVDGVATDVTATTPMPTSLPPSTTGTITSPALSLTSFTVLASNTARLGATFYNDSSNLLYLGLVSTTSTTSYTVQVPAGGFYELPAMNATYTGIVTGIALVATGNVRVTELT